MHWLIYERNGGGGPVNLGGWVSGVGSHLPTHPAT